MKYCTTCGASLKEGKPFCTKCGAKVGTSSKQEAAIVCSNCGSNVSPSKKFCTKCGYPLAPPRPGKIPPIAPVKPAKTRRSAAWLIIPLFIAGGIAAAYWYLQPRGKELPRMDVSFVPDPDPGASTQIQIDPKRQMTASLTDGAAIVVPPGSIKDGAVQVSRLRNSPPLIGSRGALSAVYDFTIKSQNSSQPESPVLLEIPISRDLLNAAGNISPEQISLQRWTGSEWRPVGSNVDLQSGKVTAPVYHLSDYQVGLSNRYITGPAEVMLNLSFAGNGVPSGPLTPRIVPQGSTVDCLAYTFGDVTFEEVSAIGNDDVEFGDFGGGFTKREGSVVSTKKALESGKTLNEGRFRVRIPLDAKPGKITFLLIDKDKKNEKYLAALEIVRPLVVILDIDGLRQDVFHSALQGILKHTENPQFEGKNFRLLSGKLLERNDQGTLKPWHFGHGTSLKESTTIFPTLTAVGHAAIFTGMDPKNYGIPGNNWFDRNLKKSFGYMGYSKWDQLMITWFGGANDRIRGEPWKAETVYEAANQQIDGMESVVFQNFYFGNKAKNAARFISKSVFGGVLYYPCRTTNIADRWMEEEAAKWAIARELRGEDASNKPLISDVTVSDLDKIRLFTLYFAGLDHSGHEGGPSGWLHGGQVSSLVMRQTNYLLEHVDTFLGDYFGNMSEATYKNTTFFVVADHGQIGMTSTPTVDDNVRSFASRQLERQYDCRSKLEELLYVFGYLPKGAVTFSRPAEEVSGVVAIGDDNSTAQVGLNGGMAQIYLRRANNGQPLPGVRSFPFHWAKDVDAEVQKFQAWDVPPSFEQELLVAYLFQTWNDPGLSGGLFEGINEPKDYRKSLAMILVRNPSNKQYEVFVKFDPATNQYKTEPLKDYFLKNPNILTYFNWEPSARSAAFLTDRIERDNSNMSGDLIIIPWYPDWYFETGPLHGDHGGISREEFEVPFAVFRPGADDEELKHVRQIFFDNIDLNTKDRPAVTDLKKIVLEILKHPVPIKQPAEIKKKKEEPVDVWELKKVKVGDPKYWSYRGFKEVTWGAGYSKYDDTAVATLSEQRSVIDYLRMDTNPVRKELEFECINNWTRPPAILTTGDILTIEVDWEIKEKAGKYRQHDTELTVPTAEARVFFEPRHHVSILQEPTEISGLHHHLVNKYRIDTVQGLSQPYDNFVIKIYGNKDAYDASGKYIGMLGFVEYEYARRKKQ